MATQYEELKQQTDDIVVQEKHYIAETIEGIETDLSKDSKAKLPEFVFKQYFLDFFKDYHKLSANDKDKSPLYAKWVELAGSEYNEVDVIDSNGEVIFTTPGLLAKPVVDFARARQSRVNDIANDAKLHNRTDIEKTNFINSKITSIMNGMITVDNNTEAKRWSKILKRFDKEKEPDLIKAKPVDKLPKVVKENLGLIYD